MSDLRLVVFDVDGTLVDSQAHIYAAMERGFHGLGLSVPERNKVLEIVGLSLPEAIARLAPEQDAGTQAELVEGYKTGYMSLRTEGAEALSPLFAGAQGALDQLNSRSEIVLGVATGKSRRGLNHLIEQHRLHGYFMSLQVADDHPSKPHPSMLHQTLRDTGVAEECAVMVGDTEYDMEMARSAGFRAIGVSWGYHAAQRLWDSGAHTVVDTFADLMQALDIEGGNS